MKQMQRVKDINISVRNLTKRFNNSVILKNLNLDVLKGETVLLLGLNGSGKSTLLKCIMDLLEIDQGEITISDLKYNSSSKAIKQLFGISADYNPLIEEFTGIEYLEFFGAAYNIPDPELGHRIQSLLSYFFEDPKDGYKLIALYSSGMKKKLSLCSAFLNKPAILILDEPFTSLDLVAANNLIALLKQYQNTDRIIIIVSHELAAISDIVSHVAVITNQTIYVKSSIDDFTHCRTKSISEAFYDLLNLNLDEKDSTLDLI